MQSSNNKEAKIRKEWLQFKGALYDHSVGFPTIPIILDEIRKKTKSHKKIGIIYLDIIESVETIHGWQTFDMVVKRIAEILKEIHSNLLQKEDVIAINTVKSGKFIIFIFAQKKGKDVDKPFIYHLLDNINSEIFKKTEDLRIKFLFPETICHIGLDFLYIDPIIRFERNLYSSINRAKENAYSQTTNFWERRHRELKRIIVNNDVQTVFQPIMKFDNSEIIGYEALTRISSMEFFNDTETLFSFAIQTEMILELERICRRNAIKMLYNFHNNKKLFLNVSAKGIMDPELLDGKFTKEIERASIPEDSIVLEITERLAIRDLDLFKEGVKKLEDSGFSVAIDDVGAGYSTLHTIAELNPSFLKYDMALVRNIHRHTIKRQLLESLITFSKKINTTIIAEGIETEGEFKALKNMGIEYGQGFFFAKPAPL